MNTLTDNCKPFVQLGEILRDKAFVSKHFTDIFQVQFHQNPWFTPFFAERALESIGRALTEEQLDKFIEPYTNEAYHFNLRKRIATVSSDATPFGDFLDFCHILLSGNDYLGKLTDKNHILLPALAQLLITIEPCWKERITFSPKLSNFDAAIVDCSSENQSLFEQYFQQKPHIIRPTTYSAAILTGQEQPDELRLLSEDIYLNFGLGNHSVNFLAVPTEYDFVPLLNALHEVSQPIADHNQYLNHIDYQKAVRLINQLFYMDAGTFLLLEKPEFASPIGIVHYQFYTHIEETIERVNAPQIQQICSTEHLCPKSIPFGTAHSFGLNHFIRHIDTMQFLGNLS